MHSFLSNFFLLPFKISHWAQTFDIFQNIIYILGPPQCLWFCLTCVRSEVNGQLAWVAAGVGAYLTLKGSLVIVDAEMLLQATAVGRRVRTVLTLVRFLSRVQTAVEIQLITTTEAFMAEFTFERPLTWRKESEISTLISIWHHLIMIKRKMQHRDEMTYQYVLKYVSPCLFGHIEFWMYNLRA